MAALLSVLTAATAGAQEMTVLPQSHPTNISSLPGARSADPETVLHIRVVLDVKHRAALNQYLADLQNPASPNFHQWLTPQQFSARFGPSQAELDSVVNWLAQEGFHVDAANLSTRTIACTGTVGVAQRAFGVHIVSNGNFFGNTDDPKIPRKFAELILSIQGLDNMQLAVPAKPSVSR